VRERPIRDDARFEVVQHGKAAEESAAKVAGADDGDADRFHA
jgi:hypothetical protein